MPHMKSLIRISQIVGMTEETIQMEVSATVSWTTQRMIRKRLWTIFWKTNCLVKIMTDSLAVSISV